MVQKDNINENDFVSDIINRNFRTADVFRSYGINISNGYNKSLTQVSENKNIDLEELKEALTNISSPFTISSSLVADNWSIDFLMDFIINVHHAYLYNALPSIKKYINDMENIYGHKLSFRKELLQHLDELTDFIVPRMKEEEDIVFPYIRQIAHAYQNAEPYARLLVRTLRKPIEGMVLHNKEFTNFKFKAIRRLTNNYATTQGACATQHVLFQKLIELENDLYQHLNLENNFLYPRIIAIEKELLMQTDF